jgi:voltage-gated potassium channel
MSKTARWERATNTPLLILGLIFLLAYATPIVDPSIDPSWHVALEGVEIFTWAAFAIDFVVRLSLAPSKSRFIRQHPLDLLAVALPLFRPLRAVRVLSIVILSARRLSKRLKNQVMAYAAVTAVAVWFIAGLAVTDAERLVAGSNINSVWDGWWWAFITMATVGFGDLYPVSVEGRLVGVALVITGIALIGTITAFIASWFAAANLEAEEMIHDELTLTDAKLDALSAEIGELKALVARLVGADPEPALEPTLTPAEKAPPVPAHGQG